MFKILFFGIISKNSTMEPEPTENVPKRSFDDLKQIVLITSDSVEFKTQKYLLSESKTIRNLLSDLGDDQTIPLPAVSSATYKNVVHFLQAYHDPNELREQWVTTLSNVTENVLHDLIMVFLN